MDTTLQLWALPVLLSIAALLSVAQNKKRWFTDKLYAEASAGLLLAGLPFLAVSLLPIPAKIILFLLHCWLLILPARFLFGRLDKTYVYKTTQVNSMVALALLIIVAGGSYVVSDVPVVLLLFILAGLSILAGIAFLLQISWTLTRFRLPIAAEALALKEQPTVSVCIPARNETAVLQECLTSVLASDYPKLEVLVLDDCSQDKTSQIIRSFAHDGVRFVQGDLPAQGWLGRNQALKTLAEHATGRLLFFISVDTRLNPQSISHLVTHAVRSRLTMVSVLPQNILGIKGSTLFGTLQHFWQMVLPVTKRRMPVSSKSWLIDAAQLKALGGFDSVAQKILPESSFARRIALASDSYRFLLSNAELGMTTAKKWHSQIGTSLRLLYPACKRQPLYVFVVFILLVAIMLAPFIMTAALLFFGQFTELFWLNVVATGLLLLGYCLVISRTHPHSWVLSTLCFPYVVAQEAVLMAASMLAYEFGEVNWKGRNVCYPVISPEPPRAER